MPRYGSGSTPGLLRHASQLRTVLLPGFSLTCRRGSSHRRVLFFGGLLPGGGEDLCGGLQEVAEFGLGEVVVDGAALGPAGDQAGFPEPDQVGGDVGLGAAEPVGQA
jgi:hypothetical protein